MEAPYVIQRYLRVSTYGVTIPVDKADKHVNTRYGYLSRYRVHITADIRRLDFQDTIAEKIVLLRPQRPVSIKRSTSTFGLTWFRMTTCHASPATCYSTIMIIHGIFAHSLFATYMCITGFQGLKHQTSIRLCLESSTLRRSSTSYLIYLGAFKRGSMTAGHLVQSHWPLSFRTFCTPVVGLHLYVVFPWRHSPLPVFCQGYLDNAHS